MCLSVRREGRGRREKGPEVGRAAIIPAGRASPELGEHQDSLRSSAWPLPMVHAAIHMGPAHLSCSQSAMAEGWIWAGDLAGSPGQLLLLDPALGLALSQGWVTADTKSCDHPW